MLARSECIAKWLNGYCYKQWFGHGSGPTNHYRLGHNYAQDVTLFTYRILNYLLQDVALLLFPM